VPGTAENKNSDVYRVSNVRFMTQGNSTSSSFANRKDNGDSLAKEPAPMLVSTSGQIPGLCWAGLLGALPFPRGPRRVVGPSWRPLALLLF
jgi:hypothetical protein